MTMDAPFVPTSVPEFDQVYTACPIEEDKKSLLQSISDVAHSYMDSTTASRYAVASVTRDKDQADAPVDDVETIERKRQFFIDSTFKGSSRLFAHF
jgi:hypothetical protein